MLEEKEIAIKFAVTYETAKKKIRGQLWDGMILDLGLPVEQDGSVYQSKAGIVLLEELRSGKLGKHNRDIPVWIYTVSFSLNLELPSEWTSNTQVFNKCGDTRELAEQIQSDLNSSHFVNQSKAEISDSD